MGHRQLRTSIMKLVVCFALIALAAASPTGMEDMMKRMMMAQAGGQKEESKGGIDDLWGVLAAAHDNERGMGARAQAATADRDITDMLELFGAGMMDEKKSEKSMGGMKDLLELFGIGMESSEKSESSEEMGGDMDMIKQMMEMFGGHMDEESKSKSMEDMMDADAEDMSEWASAEESESPMPDELRHMMQLME